jgi:hypothetical protein
MDSSIKMLYNLHIVSIEPIIGASVRQPLYYDIIFSCIFNMINKLPILVNSSHQFKIILELIKYITFK